MASGLGLESTVRHQLESRARIRGVELPFQEAQRAARGYVQLHRAGFAKQPHKRLKELPPTLRKSFRDVCAVLPAVFGYDPESDLKELDKLDLFDAQEVNRRARAARASTRCSGDAAERAWIEANGY